MNFCDFCGNANCADCSKKTRYFYNESDQPTSRQSTANPLAQSDKAKGGWLASLEAKKHRGKICNLCSRKFYVNNLLCKSFKLIEAQDATLKHTKKQFDTMVHGIESDKAKFDADLDLQREQKKSTMPEIEQLETTLIKYEDDFGEC